MKIRLRTRRVGISELMGALIMIAITLIAGAATIGWVNGQLAFSSSQIGNAVAGNINYLRENQVIVTVNYESSTAVDVWIYNRGQVSLSVNSFLITTVPAPPANTNPSSIQYINCPTTGTSCSCTSGTICVLLSGPSGGKCEVDGSAGVTPLAQLVPQGSIFTTSVGQSSLQEYKFTIPSSGCTGGPYTFASSGTTPPTFAYSFNSVGLYGSTSSTAQNH